MPGGDTFLVGLRPAGDTFLVDLRPAEGYISSRTTPGGRID